MIQEQSIDSLLFFKGNSASYYRAFSPISPDSSSSPLIYQASPDAVYGPYSTLLSPVKNENQLSNLVNIPLWEGWLATGMLFLFLLFFRYISTYFRNNIASLISLHILQKQYKENSLLLRNVKQILLIFSLFMISFWVYLLLTIYTPLALDTWYLYFVALGITLVCCLVKTVLMWIIGVVSEASEALMMLHYSGQLCVIAVGILSLPISIILLFAEENLIRAMNVITAIICGLAIILYLIRSFQIFYRAKFSLFFWILYLCTFEAAPFLVLYGFLLAN